MTGGDALYRAILCDPHDDTVRLAYADWLEEVGQELRARIIRLGIEHRERTIIVWFNLLAGRWQMDSHSSIKPVGTTKLLRKEIPNNPFVVNRLIVRRGFVEEIHLEEKFLGFDYIRRLFETHPITNLVSGHGRRPGPGESVSRGRELAGLPPLGS